MYYKTRFNTIQHAHTKLELLLKKNEEKEEEEEKHSFCPNQDV